MISKTVNIKIQAQGHLARKSFARKIFKLDGFFPIGTIN